MTKTRSPFHGYRFPAAIISCAVRWYHRFNLSLRDIEELLLGRGVTVTYESVRQWCDRFGAQFAHCAKAVRRRPGSIWHLDELFVKLRGEPYVLWRVVDERGMELDVLLQKSRDKAAAKRFFRRILRSNPVPQKIVTDQLRSPIRQHFALPRHRMNATAHRVQLKERIASWYCWSTSGLSCFSR